MNGDAGTVNGLTNTTWDIDNPTVVHGQAATEDQLKTVSDGVKTNKTNITKNANDITNINTTIGKGLNFKGDDATVINKNWVSSWKSKAVPMRQNCQMETSV